jgi:hypothetical protein
MNRTFVPIQTPSDCQRLLAQPILQWKKAHSAMTSAACWDAAKGQLPREITTVLDSSNDSVLTNLVLVAALPEWEVPLPGGVRSSFTDVLALARNESGLACIAVEAKVEEEFGPTLLVKRKEASNGQSERLEYLHKVLCLQSPLDDTIHYQLLHRTASALLIAKDFHAQAAVMLVHSFSPTARWHRQYTEFCRAMGATALSEHIYVVPRFDQPKLYLAWCAGDQTFLKVDLPSLTNLPLTSDGRRTATEL